IISDARAKGIEVELLTIGKKGFDLLKKSTAVYKNSSSIWDNLSFDEIAMISEEITQKFASGEFDQVRIVYNQCKNAATQIVMDEQYLPLQIQSEGAETATTSVDYVFEPAKERVVTDLIPQTLKTQLSKAVLDSNAA